MLCAQRKQLASWPPSTRWATDQLHENHAGKWAGKLSRNERLLVRPEGDSEPWDAVSVTVIDIDDYH